jgi:hypothetical protein
MILVIAVFVIIAILSIAVFVLFKNTNATNIADESQKAGEVPVITTAPHVSISTDISTWLTYTNTAAGFSFKYPKTVLLDKETKGSAELILTVSVEKISNIPEDLPLSMGRADVLLERDRIAKGQGEDLLKIGSISAQLATALSRFEVCSTIFTRRLSFFLGEYRVVLNFFGPREKIIAAMPTFFKEDSINCGTELVWDQEKIGDFEATLAKGQGTGIAQEWYNTFSAIINTVKASTPEQALAATPSNKSVYRNTEYGFELLYPPSYKLLTDSDSLSGYPRGIALLYTGGQAYDVVVEEWDTEEEYKTNYSTRFIDLTVLKVGTKFITFFDNTNSAKNKMIIESVKLLVN